MRTPFLLNSFTGIALFGLVISSCQSKQQPKSANDSIFFSSENETNERVRKLGLDKHSEDASAILDTKRLTIPQEVEPVDTVKGPLIKEFNRDAIIVLKNDRPLSGELVWDVLQSVGLKWGDGDLFHWSNNDLKYGDDHLFTVWTTTAPGYFLPESVKAGKMDPNDLIFGFSVPRNAEPENVYGVMAEVVKYCQKRLGGKILDQNMQPFNEAAEKENLRLLVEKMKAQKVIPGSEKALRTY